MQDREGVTTMLAITVNLMAFYIGSMIFERVGIICGVTVFLIIALAGTIAASMFEEYLGFVYLRVCYARDKSRD